MTLARSLHSHRARRGLPWWACLVAVGLALLIAQPAQASLRDLRQCLMSYDVPCAQAQADAMDAWSSSDPLVRAAAAEVHFYAGRFPEAYEALQAAVELGYDDPFDDLGLYERTLFATAGWVEEVRGRFTVRWRPGLDDVLLDEAMEALERSERYIAPLLGGPPPGQTHLEIYPDGRSFTAASSLMRADVETTGVVALSKWTRLLITSPRALARGYDWADTVAHEYIHLVVAHRGNGPRPVPVWLQEAIAKYLDSRARDGTDRFQLSVRQQGLLAEALRDDNLVTFDEMHPSLAKLPDADRAALAYAQLATLMAFSFERGGEEVLLRVLPRIKEGMDPRHALALGAGFESFDALYAAWDEWIRRQPLISRRIAALPVQLDGGDDLDADPTLHERADLARFYKLGVVLAQRNFHEAALVEYHRAIPEDEPPSPMLAARMAESHIGRDDLRSARGILESSLRDYPDFTRTHVVLGRVREASGEVPGAIEAYRRAAQLNPYDHSVHEALVRLYAERGDEEGRRRHAHLARILSLGGEDVERPTIHDHQGELILPDYDLAPATLKGSAAPGFHLRTAEAGRVRLEDHRGKVVVVDFWATWCGPCRVVMPHLSALQREHGEDLVVIGLTDESRSVVQPFLNRHPVDYIIGVEARASSRDYAVSRLPTAFVIGRDGQVLEVVVGGGERALSTLDDAVRAALSR